MSSTSQEWILKIQDFTGIYRRIVQRGKPRSLETVMESLRQYPEWESGGARVIYEDDFGDPCLLDALTFDDMMDLAEKKAAQRGTLVVELSLVSTVHGAKSGNGSAKTSADVSAPVQPRMIMQTGIPARRTCQSVGGDPAVQSNTFMRKGGFGRPLKRCVFTMHEHKLLTPDKMASVLLWGLPMLVQRMRKRRRWIARHGRLGEALVAALKPSLAILGSKLQGRIGNDALLSELQSCLSHKESGGRDLSAVIVDVLGLMLMELDEVKRAPVLASVCEALVENWKAISELLEATSESRHPGTQCSGCGMEPICGKRFVKIGGDQLCSFCFSDSLTDKSDYLEVVANPGCWTLSSASSKDRDVACITHTGKTCQRCDNGADIVGPRFVSVSNHNYSLCGECYIVRFALVPTTEAFQCFPLADLTEVAPCSRKTAPWRFADDKENKYVSYPNCLSAGQVAPICAASLGGGFRPVQPLANEGAPNLTAMTAADLLPDQLADFEPDALETQLWNLGLGARRETEYRHWQHFDYGSMPEGCWPPARGRGCGPGPGQGQMRREPAAPTGRWQRECFIDGRNRVPLLRNNAEALPPFNLSAALNLVGGTSGFAAERESDMKEDERQ